MLASVEATLAMIGRVLREAETASGVVGTVAHGLVEELPPAFSRVSGAWLAKVAERASLVLMSAYDGEGYWVFELDWRI